MTKNCDYHGEVEPISALMCPKCIGLLQEIAAAVHLEIEFTYSHPMAAERGEVWVERQKAPKLYAAIKKLQEIGQIIKQVEREAN